LARSAWSTAVAGGSRWRPGVGVQPPYHEILWHLYCVNSTFDTGILRLAVRVSACHSVALAKRREPKNVTDCDHRRTLSHARCKQPNEGDT
jgi:hypothetical protein